MPKEIYIDENGTERILSSSPSALSGLLDTDITTPSAGQVLAYDGNGKVVNLTDTITLTTSDFTWESANTRYVSNHTIDYYIGSKTIKLMSIYSTNGDAIFNARITGSNYINVLGLKTDGSVITSAYQFSLTLLVR